MPNANSERSRPLIVAGALGPGFPPTELTGSSSSDTSVFPTASAGLVYKPAESPWAFGLGVFEVAGLGVNYPGSGLNPLFTPPPPRGLGFGPVFSQFQVLEIAPALSCQLTDRLSVGVSPLVTLLAITRGTSR